jgi:hypothetical protein
LSIISWIIGVVVVGFPLAESDWIRTHSWAISIPRAVTLMLIVFGLIGIRRRYPALRMPGLLGGALIGLVVVQILAWLALTVYLS